MNQLSQDQAASPAARAQRAHPGIWDHQAVWDHPAAQGHPAEVGATRGYSSSIHLDLLALT